MDVSNKFVVYVCERLRDGTEEWAKVVTGLTEAIEYATRMKQGFNPHNIECLIFKLGEHVPLVEKVVEQPQPSVKVTVYELALPQPTTE